MLQFAARGLSDICCAGVRSCQAGFDAGFRRLDPVVGALDERDALVEAGASKGVAATPNAKAPEALVLAVSRMQKTLMHANPSIASGLPWRSKVRASMNEAGLRILPGVDLEKLRKARICVSGGRQVIRQQGSINFGQFIGSIVVLNDADGEQTQ